MARTKFSDLRKEVTDRPGAHKHLVARRAETLEEIRLYASRTDLELECFVHGALCVSWSGQCLTSEALQHRSANRGQCAQSCRLPYDLVLDGKRETARGDEQLKYLLSPKDLAAYDLFPELLSAGVCCFKIEGRMKGPEYVANVVEKYRRALDAAAERKPYPLSARDEEELRYSFSRSFSHGFLTGSDHQELVHGLYPGHRGVLVGRVEEVHARAHQVMVRAEPRQSTHHDRPSRAMIVEQGQQLLPERLVGARCVVVLADIDAYALGRFRHCAARSDAPAPRRARPRAGR